MPVLLHAPVRRAVARAAHRGGGAGARGARLPQHGARLPPTLLLLHPRRLLRHAHHLLHRQAQLRPRQRQGPQEPRQPRQRRQDTQVHHRSGTERYHVLLVALQRYLVQLRLQLQELRVHPPTDTVQQNPPSPPTPSTPGHLHSGQLRRFVANQVHKPSEILAAADQNAQI